MRTVPIKSLRLHPDQSLVPEMPAKEFADLEADIRERGIVVPLDVVRDVVVLDGRQRYLGGTKAGLTHVPVRDVDLRGESERDYILRAAVLRRHLTDDQRAALAIKCHARAKSSPGRPSRREIAHKGVREFRKDAARDEACRKFSTTRRRFDEANKVARRRPDLLEQVWRGDLKLKAALRIVRHGERLAQAKECPPPKGKYGVIVIDPPWKYDRQLDEEGLRGGCPYDVMTMEELSRLEVPAADDCALWLWATNAKMGEAHQLLGRWGFRPNTILTWDKEAIGLGRWLRNQTEHCILAVRGRPFVNLTNQPTIIREQRREHSRKPEAFYRLVESLCVGPRLEMFARCRREGWESHGIERNKFGRAGTAAPAAPRYLASHQSGDISVVFNGVISHFVPSVPPARPRVLDLTHRMGEFWRLCADRYDVVRLDLDMDGSLTKGGYIDRVHDFRDRLPYKDCEFDAVVFDPPYSLDCSKLGNGFAESRYTSPFRSFAEMRLTESAAHWARVMKPNAMLIARVQDGHHGGQFEALSLELPTAIRRHLRPWEQVVHIIGGPPPRHEMVPPPKCRSMHSYFQVFMRADTNARGCALRDGEAAAERPPARSGSTKKRRRA